MKIRNCSLLLLLGVLLFSCQEDVESVDLSYDGTASEVVTGTDEIVYPDHFPEWSWDRVPVCLLIDTVGTFSQDQIEYMAQFPMVAFEKSQGYNDNDGTDNGTKFAAAQIKAVNSKTKVLAYMSMRTDYGVYHSTGTVLGWGPTPNDDDPHPEWALVQADGDFYCITTNYRVYNHSLYAAREAWLAKAWQWAHFDNIDGMFLDSYGYMPSEAGANYTFGSNIVYSDWYNGVWTLMSRIQDVMSDKLVIGNCLPAYESEDDIDYAINSLEYIDGGMMEAFGIGSQGSTDDGIVASLENVQKVLAKGKIVQFKAWPRYYIGQDFSHLTVDELNQAAIEDIAFPLSAFLCVVEKYAYFCYSWGYGSQKGQLVPYEEYFKKLGEPLGACKKNGYIYTREFEYASVWMDVQAREGKITWYEDYE